MTDICYTYEHGAVGRGGKWLSVVFHIKKNDDYIDRLTLDEFVPKQPVDIDAVDTLGDEEKWLSVYGSEHIMELAKACRYEFDKDQMNVIFGLLRDLPIPPDSENNDIRFGRIFWLTDLYNKFVLAAKQAEAYENPIQNRYRYFCRMIENYFTAP